MMRTSHALLLRLIHDPHYDLSAVRVEYLDRGAPGDRSTFSGEEIIKIEQGFVEISSDLETKFIPIHRLRGIFYQEEALWRKGAHGE
ncbi:MAG TPA: DUF504 domain-containing protein [Methanothrix sp.]|jgi:hypothetical protein|uniref:DUF504 domain-containing protein n=2 Tax=Methanothrix sp. TaxID=90426 RepID=UPI002B5F8E1B|nr:DUF504 domain-containing protein [Methanothrix sp.]MDI9416950.1 DUF504 domain-containing protein [Euryarchaeota archaeon]HON36634.1 DUF504 domain-containing protein [Methanothrix sp.]HRU75679.1 DUF504 domain-containing protein [Methanothrix sp.]